MATKARAALIINGRILSKDFFYLSLLFRPPHFFSPTLHVSSF